MRNPDNQISSYQKLKRKVSGLEEQVRILVLEPQSEEAYSIKLSVRVENDIDKQIWAGKTEEKVIGINNYASRNS